MVESKQLYIEELEEKIGIVYDLLQQALLEEDITISMEFVNKAVEEIENNERERK